MEIEIVAASAGTYSSARIAFSACASLISQTIASCSAATSPASSATRTSPQPASERAAEVRRSHFSAVCCPRSFDSTAAATDSRAEARALERAPRRLSSEVRNVAVGAPPAKDVLDCTHEKGNTVVRVLLDVEIDTPSLYHKLGEHSSLIYAKEPQAKGAPAFMRSSQVGVTGRDGLVRLRAVRNYSMQHGTISCDDG